MTEKTDTTQEVKPPVGEGDGGKPPPAKEPPKTDAAAAGKTDGKQEAAAAAAKTEVVADKKPHRLEAGDDDIPEDAELLELSPSALKKRLGRATKKELKERFGTDNFDDIKTKMDRLATLEAAEEERKRQEMSEKDRYESDLKKEKERGDRAESRLQALYDERIIQTEESRIVQIAEKAGMDPEYIEDQFPKLAKYLNANFSAKQLKKLKDGEIEKFFKDRMKAKPKLAKEADASSQQQQVVEEKPKPKVGLTNGNGGKSPPAGEANATQEKTFKPGQKNSMSRGEARAEMNKLGYRY